MSTPAPPVDGEVAFAPAWADRAQRFFERLLVHTKGRYARAPFVLTEWQRDEIIRPLFGSARFDAQLGAWVRLYTEAWLELGRGNGKSEIMAGIALLLLCADGEEGAEVYGAAADRDQAAVVFAVAQRMVELSPILSRRLDVVESKKRIVDRKTASVYQVIAADAAGNLGQNPHGIVFDEVLSQPSRDLYDVLRSGLGKRDQPLLVCATTAGNDPESFAAHEHSNALRVAEDPKREPTRFVYIRNLPRRAPLAEVEAEGWVAIEGSEDEEDGPDGAPVTTVELDPFAEPNWYHPNPALGDFLSLATLRAEAKAASLDPTKENAFRQFRLNQWVSQVTRALPLHVWDATAGLVVEEDLEGREAFAGLDLAATSDLAALAFLFPPLDPEAPPQSPEGEIPVIWRYWCPAGAVAELDARTGGRLSVWARQGFVTITEGEVVDYDAEVHPAIAEGLRRFALADLNLDPWNSSQTIKWAEAEGITAVPVSQTFRALSPPTKELLALIRTRRLRHGGNPVTRWNADSLELKRDNSDNIRPVKPDRSKSGKRIDGILALIMALDGYLRRGGEDNRSAYEDRGLDVV